MKRSLFIACLTLSVFLPATADESPRPDIIQRIYQYASTVDTSMASGNTTYSYTRFKLNVERKNPTLLLVPSVYAIAHSGQREYVGETYSRITIRHFGDYEAKQQLRITTVPHRWHTMKAVVKYLTPYIYNETVIEDYLLSPFNRKNRKFYQYTADTLREGTIHITYKPKRNNTQLVTGDALADPVTGQILKCSFAGEYDMVNFWLTLYMGRKGYQTLLPEKCNLRTRFRFIRSKVTGSYVAYYNLPQMLTDSIEDENDYEKMCFVRPDTLDQYSENLYKAMFAKQRDRDSARAASDGQTRKNNWVKKVMWDMIGDNLLNRVKTNFGMNNQGYIRLNPILNPLYMGYDHRRGFTYKFDLRFAYQFSSNSELSSRLKAGYAFKQKQFYYRIPVFLYYNKRRNGFIKLEIGNGNHIGSLSVRRDVEKEIPDTTGMNLPSFDLLNEFKQTDIRLMTNYELSDYVGLQFGALYQKRVAVNKAAFEALGYQWVYRSFAPLVQLQVRPWGWNGPTFTADYDRSIRSVFKSNTAYERLEFNAEYIHRLHKLKSVQMRVGTGFYTWKDKRAYFLNYENFQENNLPGGWNDDWSGEFELLRSDTYNTSEYYIRSNVTYESPLLLLSWIPKLGHFMEMERIYLSVLDVKNIHPYVEVGYGFTTRLFSCGMFVSNGKGNRVFGCKFGFELFRHW